MRASQGSLFDDFEPLPSINEEDEEEREERPSESNKSVKKRFSDTVKFKYRLIKKYDACEKLLRERLGPDWVIFALDVLALTSECSGVPQSTIRD